MSVAWLLLLLALAGVAAAQDVNAPEAFAANEGLVTDVDKAAREIVIRHGPIPEMDMPPMTMAFEVKDAELLDKVKPGDRVTFRVKLLNGQFILTEIRRHEEVSVVGTREIALREAGAVPGASHELRLSLFVFHGTRWSRDEIEAAVVRSARLLAQCSVALKHAALHVLETPQRFHVYSTPVARELLRQLTVTKPAVFFVQDTQNRPAYEAEAIGRGNASSRPELADTVWIAYGARDLAQVLAHELVHVLSDSGEHSDEPDNLMAADTSPASTRLSPVQCDRLRSRGSANGLLGR